MYVQIVHSLLQTKSETQTAYSLPSRHPMSYHTTPTDSWLLGTRVSSTRLPGCSGRTALRHLHSTSWCSLVSCCSKLGDVCPPLRVGWGALDCSFLADDLAWSVRVSGQEREGRPLIMLMLMLMLHIQCSCSCCRLGLACCGTGSLRAIRCYCHAMPGVTVQDPFLPCTISQSKKNLPSHEPSSIPSSIPISFFFQFPRPQLACHSPAIIPTNGAGLECPVPSAQCPVSTARWCDRIAEGLPTPSRLDGARCYSYLSQVHGPVPSADRSDTASKVPGIFRN